MPLLVLAFYGALVVWAAMLFVALRQASYRPFLMFGIGLMLFLNIGYFVQGQPDAIAFFISLYDVLDNLGVSSDSGEIPAALATCVDNACTTWGDTYETHPSWGVAFHDRFANGPTSRTNLLYGHIAFNTVAFVLAHVQLYRPGTGGAANARRHRLLGRVGFSANAIGTLAAVVLAAQHGSVEEYGGPLAMFGFWSMAFVVFGCGVKTVTTARSGDIAGHRIWMMRYLGSMWGAFWLFRVMLFVLGPILRNIEAATILICIWFSAPLGVLIAEGFRRRAIRGNGVDVRTSNANVLSEV